MPRVTLKDVAARVGVSYQTVSKVLNQKANVAPETEARIWEAVHDLDYRPNVSARNLRTQASNLIGFGWYSSPNITWLPINDRFLHSIIDAAEAEGYLITFFTSGTERSYKDITPYAELYAQRQVDAFILADTKYDDPRIAHLIEQKIPFTAFGRSNEDWDFCWVDVDGRAGICDVVSHLHEQGHERIAFISWDSVSKTAKDREEGYYCGLQKIGTPFDPNWYFSGIDSAETGARGVSQFLSLPLQRRPTAIVCVSDQLAIGAMHAAMAQGLKVGQDVAITGYDDVPMAQYLYPSLTTVKQPIQEVGQLVIDLLLKQLRDEFIEEKGLLLEPELVVRQSSSGSVIFPEPISIREHRKTNVIQRRHF